MKNPRNRTEQNRTDYNSKRTRRKAKSHQKVGDSRYSKVQTLSKRDRERERERGLLKRTSTSFFIFYFISLWCNVWSNGEGKKTTLTWHSYLKVGTLFFLLVPREHHFLLIIMANKPRARAKIGPPFSRRLFIIIM